MIDIITVTHNEVNSSQARDLKDKLTEFEGNSGWNYIVKDNSSDNIGFGPACNLAAFSDSYEHSPYIGFMNPDCVVRGKFFYKILRVFNHDPGVVITGSSFRKSSREIRIWGLRDWVCGASFFVRRDWFTKMGGFDEGYTWSWEETDLIRQAQESRKRVKSIPLPIDHASPVDDNDVDSEYKKLHFKLGQERYYGKWGNAKQLR